MHTRPFLKWAGGKYRIVDRILRQLPPGARLVEPFAGSCAVWLNAPFAAALVADINDDLIQLHRHIQNDGEEFIAYCKSFFTPENNARAVYTRLRARFNASADPAERAALLLYLNRHSFNGLVRYNAAAAYNVPFGSYKRPYFPLHELRAFHRKTRTTDTAFIRQDFRAVFAALRAGDVVYCDPPYTPLSKTANFTAYAGNAFSAQDHRDLAALAENTRLRGIPVLLSNHNTTETRNLYAAAAIQTFAVRRCISRKGDRRGTAPELLAAYWPAAGNLVS